MRNSGDKKSDGDVVEERNNHKRAFAQGLRLLGSDSFGGLSICSYSYCKVHKV
jgi:hypothetical protein